MIRLDNINKSFSDGQRTRNVLSGFSLHVQKGEFVAITGESGAGKTTLLSILGTVLPADAGTYQLDGIDVPCCGAAHDSKQQEAQLCQLRNRKIGMVYQDHRLLPQYTVWQNVLLPCLAQSDAVSKEDEQRAAELLEYVGITSLRSRLPETLSGGEKTRVAICRALINRPAVLLADEPTGQLDAENSQLIGQLFRRLNAEYGTTIVMVTHSAEMAALADRVVRL